MESQLTKILATTRRGLQERKDAVVYPGSGAGGSRPPAAGLCPRAAAEGGQRTGSDRGAEKGVALQGA